MISPSTPNHKSRLELAEQIIPVVGTLYRENGVVSHIHGRRLMNLSAQGVVKAHRFARHAGGEELDPAQTLEFLLAVKALNPGQASLDVGASIAAWRSAGDGSSLADAAAKVVAPIAGKGREATDEGLRQRVVPADRALIRPSGTFSHLTAGEGTGDISPLPRLRGRGCPQGRVRALRALAVALLSSAP